MKLQKEQILKAKTAEKKAELIKSAVTAFTGELDIDARAELQTDVYDLFAGDANRFERQSLMEAFTGEKKPIAQTGVTVVFEYIVGLFPKPGKKSKAKVSEPAQPATEAEKPKKKVAATATPETGTAEITETVATPIDVEAFISEKKKVRHIKLGKEGTITGQGEKDGRKFFEVTMADGSVRKPGTDLLWNYFTEI